MRYALDSQELYLDDGSTNVMVGSLAATNGVNPAVATALAGKADSTAVSTALDLKTDKAANLSDLASASTARTNLGLGDAATKNTGTTAGTLAAGDDTRITTAIQSTRSITTAAPLTGGGDLSANRTLGVANATTGAVGVVQLAGDLAGTAAAPLVLGKQDVINVTDPAYGADPTGATDSTTAIQAAIDAAGKGGHVYLPPGVYTFTALTVPKAQRLAGAGWYHTRDTVAGFGDAGWPTAGYVAGTVLRSTATSGTAITVAGSGNPNNNIEGTLQGFILIGPGSGTSTGVAVGTSTQPVVKPTVRDVKVANFATGAALTSVNEGSFYDLTVQGCTKAVSLVTGVNSNGFYGLNMQRCTDGCVFEDATSLANTFVSPICQNVSGTGFTVQGESHIFTTPYFENVTTRIMDFAAATNCDVYSPSVQGAGVKNLRVQSGCFFNKFYGLKTGVGSFTITNAGFGSVFSGSLTGLTDTGSQTHLQDLNNAMVTVPKVTTTHTTGPSLQLGATNGLGVRYGTSGVGLYTGGGTPEGAVTAPVGSVYQRTGGAAGTTLWVKESGAGNTGWRPVNTDPDDGVYMATDPAYGYTSGADITASAQAAINAMPTGTTPGGVLYIPPGDWTLSTALVLKSGVRVLGAGRTATRIVASNGMFTWSASLSNVYIEQLNLRCTGGHMFTPTGDFGIYTTTIKHCQLYNSSTTGALFYYNGSLDYDNVVVEDCYLTRAIGATVPAWQVINSGGAANDNRWLRCWVDGSNVTSSPFFWIENTSNQNYAYDNRFEDLTCERNPGGVIRALSCRNLTIENITEYDSTTTFAADLIYVGKSATGLSSRSVTVRNCGHREGLIGGNPPLPSGIYDVNFVPGQVIDSIIDSVNTPTNNTTKINFGTSDRITVLNALSGSWSAQSAGTNNHFGGGVLFAGGLATARTTVANTNYTILASDLTVAYTSLTAARVITLPAASTVTGQRFTVKDESGNCSAANTLTVTPAAGTIDGAATYTLNSPYAAAGFYSDGTNWFTTARVEAVAHLAGAETFTAAKTFTAGLTAQSAAVSGLTGAVTPARFVGGTASGAPTTGTFAVNDYIISGDGNVYICTAAGTPGTWVTVGTPATLTALAADAPTVGEFVPRRERWTGTGIGPGTSGTLVLSYFTADKTETVTNLTAWTGSTAAGATPTLAKMGVYSVDGSGNLTLVQATASDTTLFAATNTTYTKALASTFTKTVGQRYACALIVVTGAAVPTFHGVQLPATAVVNTAVRVAPAIVGRVTSQTDLPSTIAVGSIVGFQGLVAFQLT